jgi:hypothetical protein
VESLPHWLAVLWRSAITSWRLPAEPSGWLSSPLALATAELVGSTTSEPDMPTSLSEPTEEMPVLSLRRIAPPGFLTQAFAVDRSDGCTS